MFHLTNERHMKSSYASGSGRYPAGRKRVTPPRSQNTNSGVSSRETKIERGDKRRVVGDA